MPPSSSGERYEDVLSRDSDAAVDFAALAHASALVRV
jgi:hypothetical protein